MRPLELLGLGRLLDSFTNNNEEVLSQNEGNSLPLVPKLLLLVIQEVTKVDVEQLEEEKEEEAELSEFGQLRTSLSTCGGPAHLSVLLHHDVGVVSVADSEDKCCYAVSCT